jgi:hypothetical protein
MTKLEKLEKLDDAMEQAVSASIQAFGFYDEITQELYSLMNRVRDMIDEIEGE